jgi:hypothetical protein
LGVTIAIDDFGTGFLFAQLPGKNARGHAQDRSLVRGGNGFGGQAD